VFLSDAVSSIVTSLVHVLPLFDEAYIFSLLKILFGPTLVAKQCFVLSLITVLKDDNTVVVFFRGE
jgi:hypothetical protein